MSRHKKHPEPVRRSIAARYAEHLRNRVKRICLDHNIKRDTLRAYVREFRGQV